VFYTIKMKVETLMRNKNCFLYVNNLSYSIKNIKIPRNTQHQQVRN